MVCSAVGWHGRNVAGVYAWGLHLRTHFSGSKLAADFIRRNGYENLLIVGSKEANVSPVTAYLNRPIYYPDSSRSGTYPYETSARGDLFLQEVMSRTAQLAMKAHQDALLVLKGYLTSSDKGRKGVLKAAYLYPDGDITSLSEPPTKPCVQITLLAQFMPVIVDEECSLYLIHPR